MCIVCVAECVVHPGPMGQALEGPPGPSWARHLCAPPGLWALVGWSLVGFHGPLWARPLWARLGPCWPTLVGSHGLLWAGPLWAARGVGGTPAGPPGSCWPGPCGLPLALAGQALVDLWAPLGSCGWGPCLAKPASAPQGLRICEFVRQRLELFFGRDAAEKS